jgi:xanthine dehydrogenase YagR molybdenum-binding subunit
MATVNWPDPSHRSLIGARISRLDGPQKTSGVAKYAYDMNRPKMLHAKILWSPYPIAKVTGVDTSAVEKFPGVVGVYVDKDKKGEFPSITYAGEIIAAVAAETEEIATEALGKFKVTYSDIGQPLMVDRDPSKASGRDQEKLEGTPDEAFKGADTVVEGYYGLPCITHCCLEAHGQVSEFKDGELNLWPSTQNVSGFAGAFTSELELSADKIHVDTQYMGGGFGSKFAADKWGIICAKLSKQTGRPVKLMLERAQDQMIAGHRPSTYGKVKVGVKKDGSIVAMDFDVWGSGGMQTYRMPPLPYVFDKNVPYKTKGRGILTNRGLIRAWRGPNHPQAALMTMCALDDAAAAIGMDPVSFFKKNLGLTARAEDYAEQIDKAAELIKFKERWHARGDKTAGPIKRGVGMSIHTWGGQGHPSQCGVTINPDGSVVSRLGTQDLGTGTRTVCAIVLADTLGLPVDQVRVEIGKNSLPVSGGSGGSTTVGGVSASSRDAGTNALNMLLAKVAPKLGVDAGKLEAWQGKIQEVGNPSKSISWKDACALLGNMPISAQGDNPSASGVKLTTGGVGGCQMAAVAVDIETGIVTMDQYVSVQDVGIVINNKTADSQLYGGAIMGITYSLFEEAIYDPTTGTMLNPDFEFYRLAGIGDIGTLTAHFMGGEKYESRGVIGLGEPAVLSQGAAISNAVANAIGVRVPELPLTPDRVLNALMEAKTA